MTELIYETFNFESNTSKEEEGKFILKGLLIEESVSDNGFYFDKQAVKEFHDSGVEFLKTGGMPIMKDHHNSCDSTVGKITALNIVDDSLLYEGFVIKGLDTKLDTRLEHEVINKVSVGYAFNKLLCNICNKSLQDCSHIMGRTYNGEKSTPIPRGIRLREVSLVPVPGIISTSLAIEGMLKRSFINEKEKLDGSDDNMTQGENGKEQLEALQKQIETLTAEKQAMEKSIEAKDNENKEFAKKLDEFLAEKRGLVVESIIELETTNKIIDKPDKRRSELKGFSKEQLDAVLKVNEKYKVINATEFPEYPTGEKRGGEKAGFLNDVKGYDK